MKEKNICKYMIFVIIAILLAGCDGTDANQNFDQSPTERLTLRKKELNDLLLSSPFGWKAVYFPDVAKLGGFTHLFKFSSDGNVEMISDFNKEASVQKSEYSIELGSTVSLVFTTKNQIHLLSESDSSPFLVSSNKGYLGDFQFLYYGQENGEIIFRTNRTSKELRFVRATARDWIDVPKNKRMIANVMKPLFLSLETNDGKIIRKFNVLHNVFSRLITANSTEVGSLLFYNFSYSISSKGITISPGIVLGTEILTEFIYSAADADFKAAGKNGISASIKGSNSPLVTTEDYKIISDGNLHSFSSIPDKTIGELHSSLFSSLVQQLNLSMPEVGRFTEAKLSFANWASADENFIEYVFSSGEVVTPIWHYFTVKSDDKKHTITMTSGGWWRKDADLNWFAIEPPDYLRDIDDQLMNSSGLYFKKENFTSEIEIFAITSANNSGFRMLFLKD